MLNLNPNVNFLLNMNNMPHINHLPNMIPVGSLNIPLFEDTPMGRFENERIDRGRREEERYHIRNPKFVPPEPMPPISLPKSYELPIYVPPAYVPPKIEILPIKPFWEEKDKY